MTALDQLADVIVGIIHDATKSALMDYEVPSDMVANDPELYDADRATALAAADAVLGMIKPLEFWVSDTGDLCCDSIIGRYQIQKGGARWCCMYAMGNKRRPRGDEAPTYHRTEEAAKAAANAHYRAQILAALGITIPD